MNARQHIGLVADKGTFRELLRRTESGNPLQFPGYAEKLETARAASGETEAVICGTASVGGQSCCLFAMEPQFMMGSMGTISPFYHIELQDKHGNPVPVGEIGEVVILPPESEKQVGVFCGYLESDEQYRRVWRGGVYHTGDAAYQDEAGRYWFHGRFDDIIKTGGYRVGPYEVENVLMEHPAVVECSVVGVPDALRRQAIKAFVVLGSGYQPTREVEMDIKDSCNRRLAEYKWIRFVEFVQEMPKTISGKIRKNQLRHAT